MIRRTFALFAVTLLLAGCVPGARQATVHHYDLAGVVSAPPRVQPAATAQETLRVARIVAPGWLDSTALYYRLVYERHGAVAAYADSDWIAPPAILLQPLLRNALAADGAWRAVLGPGDAARAEADLRIRLDDFSQVFAGPGESRGQLDAVATLVAGGDGRVLAQRRFRIDVPAPTGDAVGGVAALRQASREFVADVAQWAQSMVQRTAPSVAK